MTDQLTDEDTFGLLGGDPPEGASLDDDQAAENLYSDVGAFVVGFLAEVYAHEVRDQLVSWRWCSQWWRHPAAVARLEAAWKAWEALRQNPGTGAGVWFRDHGDPAMAALTAADGPFQRCSDTTHRLTPALPLTEPAPGLFGQPIPPPTPG